MRSHQGVVQHRAVAKRMDHEIIAERERRGNVVK